jgi:hypothetical protein
MSSFQWQNDTIEFAVVHTDGEALLQLWIKHWGDIFAVRD